MDQKLILNIHNPYAQAKGTWYRGVTDVHPGEDGDAKAQRFRDRGYHFICFTENQRALAPLKMAREDFLIIPGAEIGTPPVSLLGMKRLIPAGSELFDLKKSLTFAAESDSVVVIDHPMRSGIQPDELETAGAFHAIEVYSSRSDRQSHCSADQFWDLLLRRGLTVWGIAADDVRSLSDGARAWIMVNAPSLAEEHVLTAIRNGCFYATTGPRFHEIRVENNTLFLRCSPAAKIELIAGNGEGEVIVSSGTLLDQVAFPLTEASGAIRPLGTYLRVVIEAADGRKGWTNPLFFPDERTQNPQTAKKYSGRRAQRSKSGR